MNTRSKNMIMNFCRNYGKNAIIFIFPLLYFIAGSYFRNIIGPLSLRNCDPEYTYFMSGLTMSEGVLKVAHIDHPGTPLQLFIAVVFKIIYFIRSVDTPYLEDVFMHPDLYLSITNLTITFITAIFLIYAGRYVFSKTKSILYAILIQTTPFLPVIWYDLIGRITPELIMLFPIICLTLLTIKTFNNEQKDNSFINALLFAAITGFGLSIKLSFLPFILIPLIILKGWKKKTLFIAGSLLFFFIIAFPVTLQFNIFWNWVKAIFLHSGKYGGGESNIVDFTALRSNIAQLINLEKKYFYLFITMISVFSVYLVIRRKRSVKKIVYLNTALTVTIVVQLLMIGKHYSHHYFIPALMLSPLMILSIIETIKNLSHRKLLTISLNIILLLFIIWEVDYNHRWLHIKTEAIASDVEARKRTWHFVSTLDTDNNYKIITSHDYGSPFIEYTLTYSLAWASFEKKIEYAPVLDKLYPYTFNYFTWNDNLNYWVKKFDARKIINSGKNIYLYMERDDQELYNRTLAKLKDESESGFIAERELLFRNEINKDVIYQLTLKPDSNLVSTDDNQ